MRGVKGTMTKGTDKEGAVPVIARGKLACNLVYGIQEYSSHLSPETEELMDRFMESARKDLSKNSGGFDLSLAEVVSIYIAGNGWNVKADFDTPAFKERLKAEYGRGK
jgi:hypothetical protein